MERIITVKGTGRVSTPPDQIEIPITLTATDADYGKTMEKGAEQLAALQASLDALGFAPEDIKTVSFQINTNYENQEDDRGRWQQVFAGYRCTQSCRVSFPLDMERLSGTAAALADCSACPDFHISFTVQDPEAVRAALLEDAARNAREKAEILCRATGVTLGALLRIDYNLGRNDFRSGTDVVVDEAMPMLAKRAAVNLSFQPEDIRAEDSASFVWSIC